MYVFINHSLITVSVPMYLLVFTYLYANSNVRKVRLRLTVLLHFDLRPVDVLLQLKSREYTDDNNNNVLIMFRFQFINI